MLEAVVCPHYWVIDSPDGSTAHGACKLCGAEKDFPTSLGGSAAEWAKFSRTSLRWPSEALVPRGKSEE